MVNQYIELQKRANKLIPAATCIAYVYPNCEAFEDITDEGDVAVMQLSFISHKKNINRPIKTLNLSDEALKSLITTMANEFRMELKGKVETVH